MPEFGCSTASSSACGSTAADSIGASLGFMPEPDPELHTGDDVQIAGFYRWVRDESEELSLSGGYQKTFHHLEADRDLFVGTVSYLPPDGWTLQGTAWVDLVRLDRRGQGRGPRAHAALLELRPALEGRQQREPGLHAPGLPGHRARRVPGRHRRAAGRRPRRPPGDQLQDGARGRRPRARGGGRVGRPGRERLRRRAGRRLRGPGRRAQPVRAGRLHDPRPLQHHGRRDASASAPTARAAAGRSTTSSRSTTWTASRTTTTICRSTALRGGGEWHSASGWSFSTHAELVLWDAEQAITLGFYLQRSF
jgi:hypothetical protein